MLTLPRSFSATELQEAARDLADLLVEDLEPNKDQAEALANIDESPKQFALAVLDYVFRFPGVSDKRNKQFSLMEYSTDLVHVVKDVLRADDNNLDFKELKDGLLISLKDKIAEPLVTYIKDLYKNLYKKIAILQLKLEQEAENFEDTASSKQIDERNAALRNLDKILPGKFGHRVVADACKELLRDDPFLEPHQGRRIDLLRQQIETGHELMNGSFSKRVRLLPRVGKLSLQELFS